MIHDSITVEISKVQKDKLVVAFSLKVMAGETQFKIETKEIKIVDNRLPEVKECINCGKSGCQKIGEYNKIGIQKAYCCKCFSSLDKSFLIDLWCPVCYAGLPS